MALLEVKNLHYHYGNIRVVRGIDLKVEEGEIVTIIGANGAGKTTTLKTISGLTPAAGVHEGEILYKGKNIARMPGHKILRLGMAQCLEGRHVFSKLSVAENLDVGGYARKDKAEVKKDIAAMYEMFPRLLERKDQLAGTLSGGEQQMLAIARAMVSRPELLLLDEPSLGLAPIIVKDIFEYVVKIREQGTTVLFVEQNSKIALNTADHGYVMQNGKITLHDTSANLLINEEVQKAYLGG